jgi:hypothetical protein
MVARQEFGSVVSHDMRFTPDSEVIRSRIRGEMNCWGVGLKIWKNV